MENFLTVKQVAEKLQINFTTVLDLIANGKLEAVKIGKPYRIAESAITAYLEKATVQASSEEKAG